jgi:hypothetical protein
MTGKRRGALMSVVLLTVGTHAGCGDDDRKQPGQAAGQSRVEPIADEDPRPGGLPKRMASKSVRVNGGAVVRLPAKPDQVEVPASPACTHGRDGDGSGVTLLPPRPGVRATRIGDDRLLVEVSFGRVPSRCKPSHVRLTIDVNDDPLPPATAIYPVGRLRRPFVVKVPERVAKADVLHASSIMSTGASSNSTDVLIVGRAADQR